MDSLHQLLAEARGELPPTTIDLDRIAARGRKTIKRRRWSMVAAAVAVTLAAGSLFPFVRDEHRATRPARPAPAAPAFATRLHGFTLGDFQVGASIIVTPGYEVAPILRAGVPAPSRLAGSVELYRPGVFDPRVFRTGTPVTIGSAAGFLHVDVTTVRYGNGQKLAEIRQPAVAWPYADDAWAVVRSSVDGPPDGLTADVLRGLASHLELGAPAPVRLPFRVGYVPPGLTMAAAGRISLGFVRDTTLGRLGEVTLAPSPSFTGLTGPADLGGVTIVEERRAAGVPRGAPTCDRYGCYRGLPGTDLYLGVTGKFPAAQLRKILDGLTTANPDDQATWYPAGS
jgi:hypothetical protein